MRAEYAPKCLASVVDFEVLLRSGASSGDFTSSGVFTSPPPLCRMIATSLAVSPPINSSVDFRLMMIRLAASQEVVISTILFSPALVQSSTPDVENAGEIVPS
ncbi:11391_t:CDS:2 [Acaulospora colombiana]|uniref:11391_t:CDS:1 n=1 Tax=Acaulospora colombiana TaxID=27376 RepID=A0ACA9L8R7_9GLOM|nr:11391_t:CDS:2 [Acaulospora colombiana]